jgi:imidazolonepropionase-like amidohydrolase
MRLHFLALLALATTVPAQTKVLKFKNVVDGNGHVTPNGVIVVDGDKITRIAGSRDAVPPGAEVIDLTRYTAVPGMIDVHTHITYAYDPETGGDPWRQGQRPNELTLKLQRQNLTRTLEAGVTSVRDLGASNYADLALRDSVNKGAFVGPRIFAAGYGLQRARPPYRPGTDTTKTTRGRVFNISQIPEAVKQQVDAGVDYIKMYASTGTGADVTGRETFSAEEIKAAVDAAHQYGKRIAIHSYGPEGGRDAVRAGTNTLEHSVSLDDATLAEMARRGIYYVPTIDHNRYYAEYAKTYRYTPEQVAGLDSFRLLNIETARRAIKAGVKLGMGSDAVHEMFGQNTRELKWLVQAGLTPAQALEVATINGAAILGRESSLGRLQPGYYADVVAVDGDPLKDVNVLIDGVKWVMKGGQVVVDRTH